MNLNVYYSVLSGNKIVINKDIKFQSSILNPMSKLVHVVSLQLFVSQLVLLSIEVLLRPPAKYILILSAVVGVSRVGKNQAILCKVIQHADNKIRFQCGKAGDSLYLFHSSA